MKPELNRIYQGDALAIIRTWPDAFIQTCVTSPPYWGLRDYGVEGQLGLEKTPEEYVAKMVELFREVRRVLRDDGTLWINIGDSYCSSPNGGNCGSSSTLTNPARQNKMTVRMKKDFGDLKPKDLVGIPWMVAFALRADGWYLRSEIIWHKPNPMPESVTDRPTKAHEQIFLLAKSESYFCDMEAIKEKSVSEWEYGQERRIQRVEAAGGALSGGTGNGLSEGITRNKRTVWTVSTKPYSESHFATFPPDLISPCILAGTSEKGCCLKCGSPWERVVEKTPATSKSQKSTYGHDSGINDGGRSQLIGGGSKTMGWSPSCECDGQLHKRIVGSGINTREVRYWRPHGEMPASKPCIVSDHFMGAGTVALVSAKYSRDFIGTELNPAYVKMAEERIANEVAQGKMF